MNLNRTALGKSTLVYSQIVTLLGVTLLTDYSLAADPTLEHPSQAEAQTYSNEHDARLAAIEKKEFNGDFDDSDATALPFSKTASEPNLPKSCVANPSAYHQGFREATTGHKIVPPVTITEHSINSANAKFSLYSNPARQPCQNFASGPAAQSIDSLCCQLGNQEGSKQLYKYVHHLIDSSDSASRHAKGTHQCLYEYKLGATAATTVCQQEKASADKVSHSFFNPSKGNKNSIHFCSLPPAIRYPACYHFGVSDAVEKYCPAKSEAEAIREKTTSTLAVDKHCPTGKACPLNDKAPKATLGQ